MAKIKQSITHFIRQQKITDVEQHKRAVLTRLLELPVSLADSAEDYWLNILDGHVEFDRRQRIAEDVKALTAADMQRYFDQVLLNQSGHFWLYGREYSSSQQMPLLVEQQQRFYQYP